MSGFKRAVSRVEKRLVGRLPKPLALSQKTRRVENQQQCDSLKQMVERVVVEPRVKSDVALLDRRSDQRQHEADETSKELSIRMRAIDAVERNDQKECRGEIVDDRREERVGHK